MNPLTNILSPTVRKYIYALYAVVGLVLSASKVATSAAWVDTALAVVALVGTFLGATAASNVTPAVPPVVDAPPVG